MKELRIETNSQVFIDSLYVDTPDNITILVESRLAKSTGSDGGILAVIIEFVKEPITDVLLGIISAWLYNKIIKHRSDKITINRVEIYLSEGNIRKIISETVDIIK